MIRIVSPDDAEAIQAIYAPFVKNTVVSFETAAPSVEEMRSRIAGSLPNYPWLVWVHGRDIAGYAYASTHRARPAYRWSSDGSVYVAPSYQGQGIGRKLYRQLFASLIKQGFFMVLAGIALNNKKSAAFHETLGFTLIGIYRNIGFKLDAWHDVGWWQLPLQSFANTPPRNPLRFCDLKTTYKELLPC